MSRAFRPSLSENPVIARGGRFLQEDAGPELAAAVNELIASTPSP